MLKEWTWKRARKAGVLQEWLDLRYADLRGADLSGTDLHGADLDFFLPPAVVWRAKHED